jgi:hypothetical protein
MFAVWALSRCAEKLQQKILNATLKTQPGDGSMHWSVASLPL